jgi:hypothetical protein
MDKHEGHDKDPGFLTEERINERFEKRSAQMGKPFPFEKWLDVNMHNSMVLPHHHRIAGKDCNLLADEWFKWILRTPGQSSAISNPGISYATSTLPTENPFLIKLTEEESVYFAGVGPFQNPAHWRLFLTDPKPRPLLISVYNMVASEEEYPSLSGPKDPRNPEVNNLLLDLVQKDLEGVYELTATFDGKDFDGCTVMRALPMEVENIPKDNVMGIPPYRFKKANSLNIVYGGFFALFKAEVLTPGDHLLKFKANSVNYEIEASFFISALY